MKKKITFTIFLTFSILLSYKAHAQGILNRTVTLKINRLKLSEVLDRIGNQGNFYFSYKSNILKKDSLVSLNVTNSTIRNLLDILLPYNYEFLQSENYIIIRRYHVKSIVPLSVQSPQEKYFEIKGMILDTASKIISNASIYEKNSLVSAISNENGFFTIRLKHNRHEVTLFISKQFYKDTTVTFVPGENERKTIFLSSEQETELRSGIANFKLQDSSILHPFLHPQQIFQNQNGITNVEKTAFGRLLASSKQKIQSLNLKNFFTSRPYQFSLVPAVGTHGSLSAHVNNKFSLNTLGGYNGGVSGLELGGLFNIDKYNVQYVQIGGLFNIVGGHVKGIQIGGLNNTVLDSVNGIQLSGVNNYVNNNFNGLQISGISNHVSGKVRGVQIAGVANFAKNNIEGTQIATVINFSYREMVGTQISGLVNYTKKLKGVQIGLINVADTSDGYSLGLLNLILNGYHKLSFFTDESINANIALKTGNNKLYSILGAGYNIEKFHKIISFGYGDGTDLKLNRHLYFNPEIFTQYMYLGSWDYVNILSKIRVNLNYHIGKYFSIFAGPSFNLFYSNQDKNFPEYGTYQFNNYHHNKLSTQTSDWLGWSVGVNLL